MVSCRAIGLFFHVAGIVMMLVTVFVITGDREAFGIITMIMIVGSAVLATFY